MKDENEGCVRPARIFGSRTCMEVVKGFLADKEDVCPVFRLKYIVVFTFQLGPLKSHTV